MVCSCGPLTGHEGTVSGVVVQTLIDRTVVISGGEDKTVQV
jgi:hypothetical protein